MNIHSDYSKRVVINHNDLPWKSSPEAKVERRMLDPIGKDQLLIKLIILVSKQSHLMKR